MDYRRALLSSPGERSHRRRQLPRSAARRQLPRSAVLYGAVACVATAGPLLGLAGFTLLGSAALLLVASPVLLFFSPLLLFAASVLSVAFVGFGAAGVMALAGLWAIRRAPSFLIRQYKGGSTESLPAEGWGLSPTSHGMELGADSSSSSEQNHLEDEEEHKTKERTASENGIKEVDVE